MVFFYDGVALIVGVSALEEEEEEEEEACWSCWASRYSAHSTALYRTTAPIALSKLLTPASLVYLVAMHNSAGSVIFTISSPSPPPSFLPFKPDLALSLLNLPLPTPKFAPTCFGTKNRRAICIFSSYVYPLSWMISHRSSSGAEIVSSELAVQMKRTCERSMGTLM
ncbi:LOW QUALITY PROTEIN: hypothetical protein CVT26_001894 [Gymnopilus dilepis]|uniref:Uncharacterized protein n=1 Tax=Gymnopilus dilepis TaxID=231916 RepID=A0A409WAX8_9AGAR|nr:LOW QUALITY PROTEIN: hypothetical protein CVT26_001894 [Gymnopilus dilepis]